MTQKIIFVDAETALDAPRLSINYCPADADQWGVAKTVRAISVLCPKDVKVCFVVRNNSETETEDQKVVEFNRKEIPLSRYFHASKQTATEWPPGKKNKNVYCEILRHSNAVAENAVYLTAAQEVDPRVLAAGLSIIDVSKEENLWRTLKTLAFRD